METEREREVQRRTIKIVKKYGGYIYKNAQNIYTEKGRPDLTACIPVDLKTLSKLFGENAKVGLFLGIEMKRDGHLDEVSKAQSIVGRKIKKSNGLWFAIDDSDIIEALMIRLTGGNDAI